MRVKICNANRRHKSLSFVAKEKHKIFLVIKAEKTKLYLVVTSPWVHFLHSM